MNGPGEPGGLRTLLRGLPVLEGAAPAFDPATAPADPVTLFAQWLAQAVDRGVREPHAMTLATVDGDGQPDARVLILKDADPAGWHFAVTTVSPKGHRPGGLPGGRAHLLLARAGPPGPRPGPGGRRPA